MLNALPQNVAQSILKDIWCPPLPFVCACMHMFVYMCAMGFAFKEAVKIKMLYMDLLVLSQILY